MALSLTSSPDRAAVPGPARWMGIEVRFLRLDPAEMASYVATSESLDKASGYGIQGQAQSFVEWIRGSYYNVVGLPIRQVLRALRAAGLDRATGGSSRQRQGLSWAVQTIPPLICGLASQMNRRLL